MSFWKMETSAKSDQSRKINKTSLLKKKAIYDGLNHWYYWKTVEKFHLKCANIWTSRSNGEDISPLTLVKGCHLRLKLSEVPYSGMYCLFLLIGNISFQKLAPRMAFTIAVAWPFARLSRHLEFLIFDTSGERVRNLYLLYLWLQPVLEDGNSLFPTYLYHSVRSDWYSPDNPTDCSSLIPSVLNSLWATTVWYSYDIIPVSGLKVQQAVTALCRFCVCRRSNQSFRRRSGARSRPDKKRRQRWGRQ